MNSWAKACLAASSISPLFAPDGPSAMLCDRKKRLSIGDWDSARGTRDVRVADRAQDSCSDTVRNNIALGVPARTMAKSKKRQTRFAHEFILEKPNGYETIVGEKA